MRIKRDILVQILRFDHHFQKLKLSGKLGEIRRRFNIPTNGFDQISQKEDWEKENLWSNKSNQVEWGKAIVEALEITQLSDKYYKNIELYITLNIDGGYDIDQPDIPHHRTDMNFFRAQKLVELSETTDPETGKKVTAAQVAELYQPNPVTTSMEDSDKFIDSDLSLGTGDQVRKIISRYKKRILK